MMLRHLGDLFMPGRPPTFQADLAARGRDLLAHARRLPGLLMVLVVVVVGWSHTTARADDFVNQVNSALPQRPPELSSDRVLLPLLAAMERPPASIWNPPAIADARNAALLPANTLAWTDVSRWLAAPPQREALEGLKRVTAVETFRDAFAWTQPYGESAGAEAFRLGLVTELGEGELLATADFRYLPALTQLEILAHAEATRLQAEGKPAEALDLMVRLAFFGRQFLDRAFYREQAWGADCMYMALMRIRDIIFVDMRSPSPRLRPEDCRDIARRLRPEGMLGLDRWRLPVGERVATAQLISKVMRRGGGANADTFVSIVAQVSAGTQPLRIFSESAKWDAIAKIHASSADTLRMLDGIYTDWTKRWNLSMWDPFQRTPTEYQKLDKTQYALIDSTSRDIAGLFDKRRVLLVEAQGTRAALGIYGFRRWQNTFPPHITAINPMFVERREIDPFDKERYQSLRYFVPGLRQQEIARYRPDILRETRQRHVMQVFPEMLGTRYEPSFEVSLDASTFVLYSAGPNGLYDGMIRATQMQPDEQNRGDYLLFPPILSLVRENLIQQRRFPTSAN